MKRLLLVAAAVMAVGIGMIVITGAGAQEGDDGEGPVRTFMGRLAEKLGITKDELDTAVKEVQLEMIDEALAEGKITEEQAAKMRERVESGEPAFPFGPAAGHRPHHVCFAAFRLVDLTAEVLEIEPSDVIAGVDEGKSLAQIAEEHGLSADEFEAELTIAVQANLAEKVAGDELTQEQADRILAKFTESLDRLVNHVPDEDGPRPCRHHRPFGDMPEGEDLPEGSNFPAPGFLPPLPDELPLPDFEFEREESGSGL